MIIDYISPEKLPYLICWLDWNFYAHKISLLVCVIIMNLHYIFKYPSIQSVGGFVTASFIGFCLWVVYIVITKGYGVG